MGKKLNDQNELKATGHGAKSGVVSNCSLSQKLKKFFSGLISTRSIKTRP